MATSGYSTSMGSYEPPGGHDPRLLTPDPPDPPKTGDVVVPVSDFRYDGGIRLLEPLGRGGQGRVFRGQLVTNPESIMAVKLLRAWFLSDAATDRLIAAREANRYKLKHPNIVGLMAVGRSREHGIFLLSDFIEGCDLAEWIGRNKNLSEKRAAEVIIRVADALDAVHQANLVHGDIKPSNLLGFDVECADIDATTVKLGDFGLSGVPTDANAERLCPGGTLPYLAPECLVGESKSWGDVFALGVSLLELISGRLPVPIDELAALRSEFGKASGQPTSEEFEMRYRVLLSGLRDTVTAPRLGGPPGVADPVLRSIILKCLAEHPTDRYHTAAGVRDDLTCWLEDRETQSGYLYTRWQSLSMFFKRCRREGAQFSPDHATLWAYCYFANVVPCLMSSLFCGVAIDYYGCDSTKATLVGSATWFSLLLLPTIAYTLSMTRGRGLAHRMGWHAFAYSTGAFILQIVVVGHDPVLTAQVFWVYAACAATYIGLEDPYWGWVRVYGLVCLIAAIPVCLLCQKHPDFTRAWGMTLICVLYVGYFIVTGVSQLAWAARAARYRENDFRKDYVSCHSSKGNS